MIRMIAAVDNNWAIGVNGSLPFDIPDDLKHFRKMTMGCDLIMGRKTYDSLPGILPGRRHIVLSRTPNVVSSHMGVIYTDFESLPSISMTNDVYVIGGGEVYTLMHGVCDEILLTHVNLSVTGADAFFPKDILTKFKSDTQYDLVPGLAKVVKYIRVR